MLLIFGVLKTFFSSEKTHRQIRPWKNCQNILVFVFFLLFQKIFWRFWSNSMLFLFSRSLKFFHSKNRNSISFLFDWWFVFCRIFHCWGLSRCCREMGYSFLFLEQSLNLLKIYWLLVWWRFLKIDWWRHHFYFCLFRRNWKEIDNISILNKI